MPMSAHEADISLARLTGSYVVLHTGSPGVDGTANVAVDGADAPITPKALTFAAAGNHATNVERRRLCTGTITYDSTALKAGQTVTHLSIWDGSAGPGTDDVIDIQALTTPRTTTSDGATFIASSIEVAITVFAKP